MSKYSNKLGNLGECRITCPICEDIVQDKNELIYHVTILHDIKLQMKTSIILENINIQKRKRKRQFAKI